MDTRVESSYYRRFRGFKIGNSAVSPKNICWTSSNDHVKSFSYVNKMLNAVGMKPFCLMFCRIVMKIMSQRTLTYRARLYCR